MASELFDKVLIIAEAGVNHNGSLELALALIDAAAEAGADIVKFQTFTAEALATAATPLAKYQQKTLSQSGSQLAMLKKLELTEEMHIKLQKHCKAKNIRFLSTPFNTSALHMLCSLGIDIFKISSGDLTNKPFLRQIGQCNGTVILSTGMSTLEEVSAAIETLTLAGTAQEQIYLLHCTTEYPTPFTEVNLRALHTLQQHFPLVAGVGYSDHTLGTEVAIAAVALGARIIEKHFTLDKSLEGPDHKASVEPHELNYLCSSIRHIEQALGTGEKKPTPSEARNIIAARKSIVAASAIKAGDVFTEQNLTCKRPGNGLSPMLWDAIMNTKATRDYAQD